MHVEITALKNGASRGFICFYTLDIDELLLRQRLAVDGVGSILRYIFLNQTPLEHLIGHRRDTGMLRHLV